MPFVGEQHLRKLGAIAPCRHSGKEDAAVVLDERGSAMLAARGPRSRVTKGSRAAGTQRGVRQPARRALHGDDEREDARERRTGL